MNIFKQQKKKYVPPEILKKWVNDIEGGELYEAFIMDDRTVRSACGRSAHSSGSSSIAWSSFQRGEMNALVVKTMGGNVLNEMLEYLNNTNT